MEKYYIKNIDTPLGFIEIWASTEGITDVFFSSRSKPYDKPQVDIDSRAITHAKKAAIQLTEYFEGERTSFDLQICPQGTAFQKKVWQALLTIPYGHTNSYGKIATQIASPNASRAVGGACGKNPISIIIPCHRVITSTGGLGGFNGGLDRKRWLLHHESQSSI